ncbi:MAG TPA: hypothetical protein VGE05_08250 [Novosphingobium sp.]
MRQPCFRLAWCLGILVLAPAAAMAQERNPPDIAEKFTDPGTQAAAAATLTAMSDALFDLPIAPFVRAMRSMGDDEAGKDLPSDARVRDLAKPEANRLSEEISRRVPQMMSTTSDIMGALREVLPQLRSMGGRLRDAIPTD